MHCGDPVAHDEMTAHPLLEDEELLDDELLEEEEDDELLEEDGMQFPFTQIVPDAQVDLLEQVLLIQTPSKQFEGSL